MSGIRSRLIFGPQSENIADIMNGLKLIYDARMALEDSDATQDDRARCYHDLAYMRIHYGMRAIDDEFRLAVAAYEARAAAAAVRATRSSMPETFVVDITNIIVSYM